MKTIKAIILAAGEGTRLKKYAPNLPKGMLKFAGRTLIARQIGLFRKAGIDDICIVKGFARQKIKYRGVRYYVNENYSSTNMLASLFCAEKELEGDLIISYADILFGMDLLKRLVESKGDVVVPIDVNWRKYWRMRYGRIDFDTESLVLGRYNSISSLGKMSPSLGEINGRYIGLIRFSSQGAKQLKNVWHKYKGRFWNLPWQASGLPMSKAYMTDMLQALIDKGHRVEALKTKSGWIEFDTNEDYEKALKWYRDGALNSLVKID